MIEKENLATLGRMVATIAHEIRNPLSIIRGSAERIRKKHQLEDPAIDYITEEVDELDRILTGYLQFAQSKPADRVPMPLAPVLRRTVAAVEDEARDRGIELRVSDETELGVRGDERRIRQALLNVVLNAVQAAPDAGRVTVRTLRDGNHAVVEVTDDGPGVDPAIRAQIARPFFSTRVDGSGLGLAVVQSVMEEHRGTFTIEPGTAGGTRVRLAFPLEPVAARDAAGES
jgi:signal transduction histidine kinase